MHRVTAASGARELDYLTPKTPGCTVAASAMHPPVFNPLCKEGGVGRYCNTTGDRAKCSKESQGADDTKGGKLLTLLPDTALQSKLF